MSAYCRPTKNWQEIMLSFLWLQRLVLWQTITEYFSCAVITDLFTKRTDFTILVGTVFAEAANFKKITKKTTKFVRVEFMSQGMEFPNEISEIYESDG